MAGLKTSRERERGQQVAARTALEHKALLQAVGALEQALAEPAPAKNDARMQRTRRALAKVVGFLQDHCESAERPAGLLAEAQRKVGQSRVVTQTRKDHQRLLRDAVTLLGAMDENRRGKSLTYREVSKRADTLAASLRRHQTREADLLLEAFQRDLGGEG